MKTVTVHKSQNKTYDASAGNTTYIVDKGVEIATSSQFGIDATSGADNRIFQIAGSLSAADTGLGLGNAKHSVSGSAITLAKAGSVHGDINGIIGFMTGGKITIHGNVDAGNVGLGYIGQHGKVASDGTIHGDYYGVYLQGSDISFSNSGRVTGPGGVVTDTTAAQHVTVDNSGLISGSKVAFYGGKGNETLINSGTIKSAVQLNGGNDVYDGHGGKVTDIIDGGAGKDRLTGGSQSDVLAGGSGHDVLTGNGGPDLFVFRTGDGADTITDFKAKGTGHDQIDLSAVKSVDKFADLAGLIHQDGKDTVIDFGHGDELTLHNVAHGDLGKGDFFFG